MASLTLGFVVIIVAVLAALITGRPEPVLWGLLFFLGAVTISFVLIKQSKKIVGRKL
jgi:hypothetical protein